MLHVSCLAPKSVIESVVSYMINNKSCWEQKWNWVQDKKKDLEMEKLTMYSMLMFRISFFPCNAWNCPFFPLMLFNVHLAWTLFIVCIYYDSSPQSARHIRIIIIIFHHNFSFYKWAWFCFGIHYFILERLSTKFVFHQRSNNYIISLVVYGIISISSISFSGRKKDLFLLADSTRCFLLFKSKTVTNIKVSRNKLHTKLE